MSIAELPDEKDPDAHRDEDERGIVERIIDRIIGDRR